MRRFSLMFTAVAVGFTLLLNGFTEVRAEEVWIKIQRHKSCNENVVVYISKSKPKRYRTTLLHNNSKHIGYRLPTCANNSIRW